MKQPRIVQAVADEIHRQACVANTAAVLQACAEAGITKVAIGMIHPKLERSIWWATRSRSIVTDTVVGKCGTWPAIWRIMDAFPGLAAGCGNSDQKQLQYDAAITNGAYSLIDGEWVEE